MKADTFAKLVVLETLIDAEIGHYLEQRPLHIDFREGMISRVSDLIDQIDALDALAAARIYDAIVDFLAELPEDDDEATVSAAVRFKRATERVVRRGMRRRDLSQASTWAIVVDELLGTLAREYPPVVRPSGEIPAREYLRVQRLLERTREAAAWMLWWGQADGQSEFRSDLDRLTFAVRHQRPAPAALEAWIRAPQRYARQHRPSTLTSVGSYVLGQLLRRAGSSKEPRTA